MELAQLTMFKVVADQGSIVRASEILHCVPSNITNRIKQLEQELGVQLFIRKGRGLIISPSGTLFLDYTNRILALCQEACRALDADAKPSGVLRVGAIESAATGRLPALLAKYRQQHPAVEMQFSTATWSQLLAEVVKHTLDGAVVAVNVEHPDVERSPIYREELVVIAASDSGVIHSPLDLQGRTWLMWPEGCPYRQSLQRWLTPHGLEVNITSIASYGTILGCVRAGEGVSLVPKGLFEQFKNIGGINGFSFADLAPVQNYFICNKHTGSHPAKDSFAALLGAEYHLA
ncbi:LysR family transcriptional regulator [Pseudomonas shirazensis]|uniref:LysR family transcriptional regulator n=1 Tax=Pseudomonas shirazensis TaxID=2745494 RepID=A0ABU9A2A6_9PSED|nr:MULTISPECIES: LysR family transcriptional regulator [Pseudomonas]MBO0365649.1 LysR family transcriptional regulator [Pseudomonas putida]MBV4502196.1 LysR family transcriptional regulator [Pseudomonas shirazensis]